jgi:hypothetical protein
MNSIIEAQEDFKRGISIDIEHTPDPYGMEYYWWFCKEKADYFDKKLIDDIKRLKISVIDICIPGIVSTVECKPQKIHIKRIFS